MLLRPHPLLWTAIETTHMIRFAYHGRDRIAEPHDHGILNGSVQLLSWQVAGRSTRRLPNWLLTKVDEINDFVLLEYAAGSDLPGRAADCFRQTHQMGRALHPGKTHHARCPLNATQPCRKLTEKGVRGK